MKTFESNLSSSKVQVQLALCAAAVTGIATAPAAEAALVTTFDNTVLSVPATTSGVYLNLLTGTTGTSSALAGWDFNPYSTTAGLGFYWNQGTPIAGGVTGTSTGTTYLDLAPGATISSASFFTAAIQGTSAAFRTTGNHILGFRFADETTGAYDYGFLKITTTTGTGTGAGFPATITGWRFDNTGAAVTVPVPEPSTVAILALVGGAAAVRACRRRKVA